MGSPDPKLDAGDRFLDMITVIIQQHGPSRKPFFAHLVGLPRTQISSLVLLGPIHLIYQSAMHVTRAAVYYLPHLDRPTLRKRKLQILIDNGGLPGGGPQHYQLTRAFRNIGNKWLMKMNQILAARIQRVGHTIDLVAEGTDAGHAVQSKAYDPVLMDAQRLVMDAREATRQIRRLPGEVGNDPIIALISNMREEPVAQFRAAGMNDHVGKPIVEAELPDTINHRLPDATSAQLSAAPEPSSPATAPVIQREIFDDLKESLGPERSQKVIQMVRHQLHARLGYIDGAAVDLTQLAANAHMLIGTVGLVGMMELSERLRELEAACLNDCGVDIALVRVREACDRALQRLALDLYFGDRVLRGDQDARERVNGRFECTGLGG